MVREDAREDFTLRRCGPGEAAKHTDEADQYARAHLRPGLVSEKEKQMKAGDTVLFAYNPYLLAEVGIGALLIANQDELRCCRTTAVDLIDDVDPPITMPDYGKKIKEFYNWSDEQNELSIGRFARRFGFAGIPWKSMAMSISGIFEKGDDDGEDEEDDPS